MQETKSHAELENELDRALKATFPASDPFTVGEVSGWHPDRPRHRKPARLEKALVEELAAKARAKK